MSQPAPGALAWFEVATSDPDGAEKFYGSLFDWTFEADGPAASGGLDYRNIKASGAAAPMGGIFGTGGQAPGHAVFYILVADVEATCADAEQLGGSVVSKHLEPGPGAPTFAYLRGPSGQSIRRLQPTRGLMTEDAKGTSSPGQSGEGDARALYDTLTEELLYDPAVGRATMMGYPCVRLAGRFLASYDNTAGRLVVKLPRERVTELVESGHGDPFAPAGKVFREWVSMPVIDRLPRSSAASRSGRKRSSDSSVDVTPRTSPWRCCPASRAPPCSPIRSTTRRS